MKRKSVLVGLLCLGVLSALSGCYIDPALSRSYSVDVGVSTYYEEDPYYWRPYPYRWYDWEDDWRSRRYYRPYPYRTRPPYYGGTSLRPKR
jgi:hypothetical protein